MNIKLHSIKRWFDSWMKGLGTTNSNPFLETNVRKIDLPASQNVNTSDVRRISGPIILKNRYPDIFTVQKGSYK
uniref:Uncharacterized protein n=1 Tax=Romanomermis culicivorax TaxID=13658 RepID=A0A915K858_ROMCU